MAHVKTYLRIKPSARPYDDYESTLSTVYLRIPEAYKTDSSNAAFKPKLGRQVITTQGQMADHRTQKFTFFFTFYM